MIILDTNVLSALMRETPDAPVVAWLDRRNVRHFRDLKVPVVDPWVIHRN